jgi:glycosyltransferase involved in cell wall biosynthesis
MFGWEFPPHISGGLGTACYGLTQALAAKGTDITFVVPRLAGAPGEAPVRLMGANQLTVRDSAASTDAIEKTVREIGITSPLVPYLTREQYAKLLADLRAHAPIPVGEQVLRTELTGLYGPNLMAEVLRYSMVAGAIARSEQFDVIHVHDWMTFMAGVEAKRVSGKPLVVHVHSIEFDRSGEHMNHDIYEIERWGFEHADKIIAVSYYTRELILRYYQVPESKITVVHNAVSKQKRIEQLNIQKPFKEKIVLFLGRITFQKGPDYFLEAANKVIQRVPNVRFVMAGSGDMFEHMVERMAQLRIGHHFHFTGFLRGADVERMYAMSDLYVMPSVSEPFGIAPLEAMVYNVPCIVSKQSGVAEVLPSAIKVDFWDIDKLADKIIAVLTHEGLARQMTEQNTALLRGIKWEKAADKVLAVYQGLGQAT